MKNLTILAQFDANHLMAWGGFLVFVLVMLAVDLFVLHRKAHEIRLKEALIGVLIPVTVALAFIGVIYWAYNTHFLGLGITPAEIKPESRNFWPENGKSAALMYLTGYIVEISLSADNVFLFVVLMNFFAVPAAYQHRVLFWGVLGALVMRAVMIIVGAELISQFSWIIYIFGAFLIFTGIKMFYSDESQGDPNNNIAVKLTKKLFPVTEGYRGQAFFVKETLVKAKTKAEVAESPGGFGPAILHITPLFLVLVCIEFTDLVFAVDSIPAIFGITQDPFIVFTSNVFAILGLRSMYFLLAGVMDKFHYLKVGLSAVLTFVGVKMILPALGAWLDQGRAIESKMQWFFEADPHHHWHVKVPISLGFIVLTLAGSIVASLIFPKKEALEHNPLTNP